MGGESEEKKEQKKEKKKTKKEARPFLAQGKHVMPLRDGIDETVLRLSRLMAW